VSAIASGGPERAPLPRVVVVGLGPAGADLLTAGTLAAIEAVPHRFVRTTRHPAATVVADAASFDDLYEAADSFDDVYAGIVEALVAAATEHGEVLYAVPGSPAVAERAVDLLRADDRVVVEVLPALSFLDLVWARLGVDPVALGARLVDGRRFEVEAAGERGPLLVGQCDQPHVLSAIKLAVEDRPAEVVVLQRLGLPDESVRTVAWEDLDREVVPDHLTSIWIPHLTEPVAAEVARFHELVRTLRTECPWDREQTHQSLTRHLLEEAYEVLEAIDHLDADGAGFEHLEEELGDLLFQVVFHAVLAEEAGQFTLADVARGIHDKLRDRHPHVFDPAAGATTVEQLSSDWERRKVEEKGRGSVMEGIPVALPALAYAAKVQKKAASQGVDWRSLPGIEPGTLEARLLELVDEARTSGSDPESALRTAVTRLRDAYRAREDPS